MKSCMCTVYLMTKCSCNHPLQAYGAIPGKSNEKLHATSYTIMNSHSQWQSFEFSAASSYLRSKYVEKEISSPLFSPHSTLLLEKILLGSLLWWKLYWSIQQRERQKPNQADVKANEKHHRIYFTEALVLALICILMYASTYCTCTNTAMIYLCNTPTYPSLHAHYFSTPLFILFVLIVILSITYLSLHILSLSLPLFLSSLSPSQCVVYRGREGWITLLLNRGIPKNNSTKTSKENSWGTKNIYIL